MLTSQTSGGQGPVAGRTGGPGLLTGGAGPPRCTTMPFPRRSGVKESVIKVLGGLPKGAGFQDIRLDRTDRGWGVSLRGHLAVFGAATPSGSIVSATPSNDPRCHRWPGPRPPPER